MLLKYFRGRFQRYYIGFFWSNYRLIWLKLQTSEEFQRECDITIKITKRLLVGLKCRWIWFIFIKTNCSIHLAKWKLPSLHWHSSFWGEFLSLSFHFWMTHQPLIANYLRIENCISGEVNCPNFSCQLSGLCLVNFCFWCLLSQFF